MSPDAQRIAIANAQFSGNCAIKMIGRPKPHHYMWGSNRLTTPDYLNDLNAMHEAEKVLTDRQRQKHGLFLQEILNEAIVGYVEDYQRQLAGLSRVSSATATQRAKAFLCAIGRWEDGE